MFRVKVKSRRHLSVYKLCSSSSLNHSLFSSIPSSQFQTSSPLMSTCIDTCRTGKSQDDDSRFYCMKNFFRPGLQINQITHTQIEDDVWIKMLEEAKSDVEQEPILSNYYYASITSHRSLDSALAHILSVKLSNLNLQSNTLFELFISVLQESPEIIESVKQDLIAVKERDPACISYVHCFLSFKGFLACQAHRIAHKLWKQSRKTLALLIQNRVSETFGVDFHPGAKIGKGILLDHATAVVIGETAVIGDNVSILHGVTLGGTGKQSGDRHPKIGDGVLIGAGTCILGNITIGEGAKIGSGSVVLKDVPPRTTAVGNPARLIGGKENPKKHDYKVPGLTMDQTSYLTGWSDYVI
ncbi:Serine acetyltransferase 1 [Cardamine amara subsp. amara]|uniref:serine O-acetyltransferase n=1 Tax=Cardamine amara subsp. amara TaxID=228776 RepID=A0ABD1BW61_CARAN